MTWGISSALSHARLKRRKIVQPGKVAPGKSGQGMGIGKWIFKILKTLGNILISDSADAQWRSA